jgi:hypothetical protein
MKKTALFVALLATSQMSFAGSNDATNDDQVQDMSDPLAVYTQAGAGVSDKGLNVKVGQTYDTGNPETMGMNIIEVKGVAGEALGWSGNSDRDNSIDSFRFRNFSVNTTNGRGAQVDLNYNVEQESLNASYSFIQALPKMGPINLYPLAGLGVNINNGEFGVPETELNTTGYTLSGTYAVVGAYTKLAITDKLWLNYNPMWLTSVSGSDIYVDNAFGKDNSNLFTNEFIVSYQFTPRFNLRYFANWTQDQSYLDGDQRVEFNYQF